MKQLKITANLLDGRIITNDGYLPFDGILSRAIIMKERPELIGQPLDKFSDFVSIPLPIKKIKEETEDWFYACSYALFKKLGEDRMFFNKRYDEVLAEKFVDFGKKKGVVDTSRGKYKNYRCTLNIILTDKITWYCLPNSEKSKSEIEELCGFIKNIGKKPSQGFGIVKKWEVEEVEEKEMLYLLRAIPDKDGKQEKTIRPPYFSQSNIRKITIPSDERLGCNQIYKGAII